MPEPFKNLFNLEMIALMGSNLTRVNSGFDSAKFVALAGDGLDQLELKERSNQITCALEKTLGDDFTVACQTMVDALHPVEDAHLGDLEISNEGIRGWAIMPMGEFIARHGMGNIGHSLDVLGHFTKRFSAEFAIRPFFINSPEITLNKSLQWSKNSNFHLRRLASEGSRPRLPWGLRLQEFVFDPAPLLPILENLKDDDEEYVRRSVANNLNDLASEGSRPRLPWGLRLQEFVFDPAPLLPILENLKDDDEEYVRRSVANNLNDIAKDHPDLVAAIAAKWMKKAGINRQRLVKHACRSLIKSGHKPTLEALGYGAPDIKLSNFQVSSNSINLGDSLEFEIEIQSTAKNDQPLIVDFIIHHRKANGGNSPKTFKWKNIELKPGKSVKLTKRHPIKPITTRTYYAGEHQLEIQINGTNFGQLPFELIL